MTKDNLKIIAGKTIDEWKSEVPIISDVIQKKETVWMNPNKLTFEEAIIRSELKKEDKKNSKEGTKVHRKKIDKNA